jgi:hypothetical protein
MAGNLIQGRVLVSWGDINLSAYNGPGEFPKEEPLIYNVEVQLQSQTSAPTGTFKWNPSGAAYAEYERLVKDEEQLQKIIFVDFYYSGGKRLRLAFVWAGQNISYGNDMTVVIVLKSELDGLINSNIRNVAQAYDKGESFLNSVTKAAKQYDVPLSIVRYNDVAKRDLEKAKLSTNYGQDQTFGAFVANTVQQNGNIAFANNIETANIVIYPPFSWNKDTKVLNAATEISVNQGPKPENRYGYLLGPSLITSVRRESQWLPPQQTTQNTPNKHRRVSSRALPISGRLRRAAQVQANRTFGPTSAVLGTALGRANPGVQNKHNPDGPTKQYILNEEGTAILHLETYMCPVLTGIKPLDIVYIPSFGKLDPETKKYVYYIEDWIVDTVSYDQNDGRISLSISARRTLGLGTPMVDPAAQEFLVYAQKNNLVGPGATLDAWDRYAWSLPGK